MRKIGRYEIVRELGEGGMGKVWLGRDPQLEREVAIKSILPKDLHDATAVPRLMREARAAAKLNHPGIVAIYDIFGRWRCAVHRDGVRGGFSTVRGKHGDRAMPAVADAVCRGVDHAHRRGIVHRDIEPQNMLVSHEDEVKIADFGLAKKLDSISKLTSTGAVLGTVYYLSPEQLDGQDVNGCSDQYALAVVAYRWLTGCRTFDVEDLVPWMYALVGREPVPATVRNPGLPKAVDEVLGRALAKKKEDRFKTCVEFVTRLKAAFSVVEAPTVKIARVGPVAGEIRENSKDGMKYVWIPPGRFWMGASPGDEEAYDWEKPAHEVTITRGFCDGNFFKPWKRTHCRAVGRRTQR